MCWSGRTHELSGRRPIVPPVVVKTLRLALPNLRASGPATSNVRLLDTCRSLHFLLPQRTPTQKRKHLVRNPSVAIATLTRTDQQSCQNPVFRKRREDCRCKAGATVT